MTCCAKRVWSDITVTELCDRAVIRKATFYKHFGDKTELLTYMIQELQRISLEENKIGYDENVPHSYYIGVFRYFIDFLDSNERFITSVLKSNASAAAETIMSGQIEADIRQHLKREKSGVFAQYSRCSQRFIPGPSSTAVNGGSRKNARTRSRSSASFQGLL
jgi:AcrR family transcriptional regulator